MSIGHLQTAILSLLPAVSASALQQLQASTILEETTGGFQQSVCFILCTHTDHAHCTLDLPRFAPHSETQLDITAENCVMVCLWVLHLSSKLAGRNDLLSIRDHFSWNERVTYSGVCIFKTTAHFQLNTATCMW